MKISELTPLSNLQTAAQIPVAINGENRSVSIGQILSALQSSIAVFDSIVPAGQDKTYATGSTMLPVFTVFDPDTKKFYGGLYISQAGTNNFNLMLYSEFAGMDNFYRDGGVRTDCLFATKEGRLYRFSDGLISCGLTDEQAELLQKLTPKELASEAELEALKAAGEIIPGQLYYIAETE